jgi:hypothetical protein
MSCSASRAEQLSQVRSNVQAPWSSGSGGPGFAWSGKWSGISDQP